MNSAIYNATTVALSGSPASIVVRNHPLPYTARQTIVLSGINAVFIVLGVVIGFSFIAAFYASFIVSERENSAKHQQVPRTHSCCAVRALPSRSTERWLHMPLYVLTLL